MFRGEAARSGRREEGMMNMCTCKVGGPAGEKMMWQKNELLNEKKLIARSPDYADLGF